MCSIDAKCAAAAALAAVAPTGAALSLSVTLTMPHKSSGMTCVMRQQQINLRALT
jgi:hypothetical protein